MVGHYDRSSGEAREGREGGGGGGTRITKLARVLAVPHIACALSSLKQFESDPRDKVPVHGGQVEGAQVPRGNFDGEGLAAFESAWTRETRCLLRASAGVKNENVQYTDEHTPKGSGLNFPQPLIHRCE